MITNLFVEYYNYRKNTTIPYSYFSCTSPQRFIYISYDGKIAPCAAMTTQATGDKDKKLPDELSLLSNSVASAIESEAMRDFVKKKTSIELQRQIKPCGTCKFLGNYMFSMYFQFSSWQ